MPFLREKTGTWSPERITAFVLVIIPGLVLVGRTILDDLGARPVTELTHATGTWTVRFILLALAVTPARRLFNWPKLLNARRTVGVAAACYALVHFSLYIIDQKFMLTKVASEIVLRVYLTIGFTALVGLIALAATSTDAAVHRLGARWTTLHRAVYAIGILAIVHFAMQKKLDIYEPTLMMGFLFWLLGWRLINRYWRDTSFVPMLTLSIAAAFLTAIFEASWYGVLTGAEFMTTLEFNLMFDIRIAPSWWVLVAGAVVAIASAGAQWFWPRIPARTRLTPAE